MQKNNFKERVRNIVRKIPKGEVLSYGQVAAIAGSPGAARAVGNIMANNFDSEIPCHRVIKSSGEIGGYNRGLQSKAERLRKEGYKGVWEKQKKKKGN